MSEARDPTMPSGAVGLAAHIVNETSGARLERQWADVSGRLGARRARWRMAAIAVLVVFAFVLGTFAHRHGAPSLSPSWMGATFESTAEGEIVTLPGGSRVELAGASVIRIGEWTDARATLLLERGQATFDIQHVEGRAWVVAAGAYDVRVVGTKFVVRREIGPDGDRVSVTVLRGHVEVQKREAGAPVSALTEGQSWRDETPAHAAAGAIDGGSDSVAAEDAGSSALVEAQPPPPAAQAPPPAAQPPPPSATAPSATAPVSTALTWEDHARAHRYREAYDALGGAEGFAHAVDASGPEKLFRLGEVARSSGHMRDAERAFDTLRRRHRNDGRAALAAFELGRLRQDALGNPGGAAEAFGDAIALAPTASFREDAEARRVQALDATHAPSCAAARDAYLARYPNGARAGVVRTRCGGSR